MEYGILIGVSDFVLFWGLIACLIVIGSMDSKKKEE